MMEKQIKQLYVTPDVGVYETKVQAVICQSSGINDMGFGSEQGDENFN